MKLETYKRLNFNDFNPEYKELIENLATQINRNIEPLFLALSNRLTLSDNSQAVIRTITLTVNSDGTPTNSLFINLQNTPVGIALGTQVILVTSNDGSFPTSQPFISFEQNGSNLKILNITGLNPNIEYSIRFIVYG